MDKFRVFVYMLMRDARLKQRILCIIHISIFGAFSAGKKCVLYTSKYGILFQHCGVLLSQVDQMLFLSISEHWKVTIGKPPPVIQIFLKDFQRFFC